MKTTIFLRLGAALRRVALTYSVQTGDGSARDVTRTRRHKLAALVFLSGLYALCLSAALACCEAPCAPLPADLVSWWPGNLDAKDIIRNHHGTLQGGVIYAVPGKVGDAFSFNGTGAVNIPNQSDLSVMTGNFSVDAWVRFTGTLAPGETAVIFQNYGGVPAYTLAIDENYRVYFSFRDDASNSVTATGSTSMNDGAWHFVAGVRDGATGYIYVDGKVESSDTNAAVGPINITCQTAHIGGTNTGPGHCTSVLAVESFFTGDIDEVEVFQRALTLPEIVAIYEADCAGKCFEKTKLVNISTRAVVGTGNDRLIGGFIITGNAPKKVVIRGIGPSLTSFGINNVLADPTLELFDNNGILLANDEWQEDPTQAAQIEAVGLAPTNNHESAIIATLPACALYTAILAGKNGGTGVGLVEIYDIDEAADSELANLSTRGFVQTDDNVMIAGFILRGASNDTRVALRGIGPSLPSSLAPLLPDPTLQLHATTKISNDDWQQDPLMAKELTLRKLDLPDPHESGIFTSLAPGAFTAILAEKNKTTGTGLAEIYSVH